MASDPKEDSKNKRLHPRVDFFNRVKIVVPDTDTSIDVFAANVSKGGMFLRSNRPLPKGKTIKLQFDTEKGPVEVDEGKVIWNKPFEPISIGGEQPGMGIQFRSMSQNAQSTIESFIEDALADTPEAEEKAPLPPPPAVPKDMGFALQKVEGAPDDIPLPAPAEPQASEETSPEAVARMALPIGKKPAAPESAPLGPGPSAAPAETTQAAEPPAKKSPKPEEPRPEEVEMAVLSTPPPTKTRLLIFVLFVGLVAVVTFLTLVWLKPFEDKQPAKKKAPVVVDTPKPSLGTAPEPKPEVKVHDAKGDVGKPEPKPEVKVHDAKGGVGKPEPKPEVKVHDAKGGVGKPEVTAAAGLQVGPPSLMESSSGWRLFVKATGAAEFKHFTLKSPPRLAIDVKGAAYAGKGINLPAQAPFISKIRVGKQEGFTRFVMDFAGDTIPAHRIHKSGDSLTVIFKK